MTEWRDIPGWEGRYQASDDGQIRSLVAGPTDVMKVRANRYGHLYLRLTTVAGKKSPQYVHRLVAFAFLGEPTGPMVRHLDGDPTNNSPANLAYGTASDNNHDTARHGRHVQSQALARYRAQRQQGLAS